MDLVSVLRQQTGAAARIVAAVGKDQLGDPTPCTSFDVRALINHMCMGNHFLARVAAGEKAEPDYETDFIGDDPSGAYERSKEAMLEAFSAPGLAERTVHLPGTEVPGAVALALALMEAVVHRWDLAKGTGADPGIDPQTATMVLETIGPLIPDALRAPMPEATTRSIPFGPPVPVPEGASPLDQLLGFLGRTP